MAAAEDGASILERIDAALRPSKAAAAACGGFDGWGSFKWCRRVLSQAVGQPGALGLSYGILTWDRWTERMSNKWNLTCSLYDCFCTEANCGRLKAEKGGEATFRVPIVRHDVCVAGEETVDEKGRRFEPLAWHLAPRPASGTLVKLDVEGSEWAALESTSDEALQKIDLLDLEIHWLMRLPPAARGVEVSKAHVAEVKRRLRLLERLLQTFAVTSRHRVYNVTKFAGVEEERAVQLMLREGHGKPWVYTAEVAYVNKKRLGLAG